MIIHDLNACHSVQEKLARLRKATELEKKLFLYTYDKERSYGVTPPRSFDVDVNRDPYPEMFEVLDKLSRRKITGGNAEAFVKEHAEQWGGLIYVVLSRKLHCAVATSLINRAIPGCIPLFSLQLARTKPLENISFPCLAQLKYDGVRIAITWDGIRLLFRTRNGKIIHLPDTQRVLDYSQVPPFMLDTEVTLENGTTEDRPKVAGLINSARCRGKIDESQLRFFVFDGMSYGIFKAKIIEGAYTYSARLKYVRRILSDLQPTGSGPLELATTETVYDVAATQELFEQVLSEGQEGLILKPFDHLYTFKRSVDWIKMKATDSVELVCVGVNEGEGKYQGMIGALRCEGRVKGLVVSVRVGTGLSDHDRELPPSEYIGKQIEVDYNSVIQNSASGKHSLFLPRFVGIRHDK